MVEDADTHHLLWTAGSQTWADNPLVTGHHRFDQGTSVDCHLMIFAMPRGPGPGRLDMMVPLAQQVLGLGETKTYTARQHDNLGRGQALRTLNDRADTWSRRHRRRHSPGAWTFNPVLSTT